jgi:hypothetical protein
MIFSSAKEKQGKERMWIEKKINERRSTHQRL